MTAGVGWTRSTIGGVTLPITKHKPQDHPDTLFHYIDISAVDNSSNTVTTAKEMVGSEAPSRARQIVEAGDTVLSTVRTYLRNTAIVPVELDGATASTGFSVLRSDGSVDPRFLYYRTLESQFVENLSSKQAGSSYPAVRDRDVRAMPISFPSLDEQRRIVATIEMISERIQRGSRFIASGLAKIPVLEASVLTAGVEGLLCRQLASDEPASVLLERIGVERRRRWVALRRSEFEAKGRSPKSDAWRNNYPVAATPREHSGPLPTGWQWATWDQLGFSLNGRAFPSRDYSETGVKLLRPGNLGSGGRVEWTEKATRYLPMTYREEFRRYLLRGRSLVMNLTAQSLADAFLGRVCLSSEDDEFLLNQRIALLQPIEMDLDFIYYVFRSPLFRQFVAGLNKGSLIQHLYTSELAEFLVPVPPLAEQRRIADRITQVLSETEAMRTYLSQQQLHTERLDSALLRAAFEGSLALKAQGAG